MKLISLLFVIPVLLLALGTIAITAPAMDIKAPKHRYASIDGLRGFLAMFVFLHHSSLWYYFVRLHQWGLPSGLFYQFGSTSVAMFFMITSFLFFSKLIEGYGRSFDWLTLYVGRIMRIVPLYLLAVFLIFLTVGFVTHFTLHETFGALMIQLGQWIMIMGSNVNQLIGTKYIICGVQWSLAYEWMFYCSLAVIGGVFFRLRPSLIIIFIATAFLIVFALIIHSYYLYWLWWRLCPFLSGLAAAFVALNEKAQKFFSHLWVTPGLIALGYIATCVYPLIISPVPMLCMTLVFIGLVCGNDLFGLLIWKPCRLLGQISYSIYLLHGIVLFITFYFALGFDEAASLSIVKHWLTICICCIFVIILCAFSYCYIEKPGIDCAAAVTKKIRNLFQPKTTKEGVSI